MSKRTPGTGGRRRSRRIPVALVLLMLAAAGVRLGVGLARVDQVYWLGDSRTYRELGENLASGRGLVMEDFRGRSRRADRMPGYPLVLGVLHAIGGGAATVVIVQAGVGTLATWVAWRLGRAVLSPVAGWVAAGLTAFGPWQVYFATVALTECWSAALLPATVLCMVGLVRSGRLRWALAAGALCAALGYVHPEFLGLPAAMAIPAAIAPGRRRWLLAWGLGSAVVLVALAPWWVRNAKVFGDFVPATTRLGPTLYDGLRPGATGASDMRFEERLAGETAALGELRYDDYYRSKSLEAAASDPGRVVRLAGAKAARLWSPVPNAEVARAPLYRWLSTAAFVPMVAGGLLGAVVLLRRAGRLVVLLVPVAWVTMVHGVLVGSIRYRVPVEPLLFVLAGAAAAWVCGDEGETDERPTGSGNT